MRKVIVTVAPVCASPLTEVKNPLSPKEIADEVINSTKAGASMVHLHVRDLQGQLTEDLAVFSQTLDLIREESDIIIQASTGGVSELSLEERCVAINDPRVEVASLNMGSVNLGESPYINSLSDIRYWASRMNEQKVHPELEIFEAGMINNAQIMVEEGLLNAPLFFAFAIGFKGALQATPQNLYILQSLLPQGARWGLNQHGMKDFSLLATAVGMGASMVRVGFEDGIQYASGKIAQTNTELVERIVALIRQMGLDVVTPAEAREMLGLSAR